MYASLPSLVSGVCDLYSTRILEIKSGDSIVEDYPIKKNDLLNVLSVSTSRMIVFLRPNGERYRAEYLSPENLSLAENDFLLVKNVYCNNGSASCERVSPGRSGSSSFALLNPRILPS